MAKLCQTCKNRVNKICRIRSEFVPRKAKTDGKIIAENCGDFKVKR